MRLYRYVGPKQIADRVGAAPAGVRVRVAADVLTWVRSTGQQPAAGP